MKEYLVVFERGPKSWGAYAPDVPGCVAVGKTQAEAEELFREALRLHLELMQEHGEALPKPRARAVLVTIASIRPRRRAAGHAHLGEIGHLEETGPAGRFSVKGPRGSKSKGKDDVRPKNASHSG